MVELEVHDVSCELCRGSDEHSDPSGIAFECGYSAGWMSSSGGGRRLESEGWGMGGDTRIRSSRAASGEIRRGARSWRGFGGRPVDRTRLPGRSAVRRKKEPQLEQNLTKLVER